MCHPKSRIVPTAIAVTLVSLGLTACGEIQKSESPRGASADATPAPSEALLLVDLPPLSSYPVANRARVAAYQLNVVPVYDCPDFEDTEIIDAWAPSLALSVIPGCSFTVELQLGVMGKGQILTDVILSNIDDEIGGQVIDVADDAARTTIRLTAELMPTALGREQGFTPSITVPDGVDAGENPAEPVPVPAPPTPAQPTPSSPAQPDPTQPTPDSGAGSNGLPPLALGTGQDFAVKRANGSSAKISELFDAKYLVLDISASSCGYCVTMAREHESDSAFKAKMDGTDCRYLTVVTSSDLSAWLRRFATGTFIGDGSIGVDGGLSAFTRAFGVSLSGTPTVFMVDRSGQMVANAVGSVPGEVERLCKGGG